MVKNFKLVILGPENSGKSALVTQFLDNRFVEDYEPTKISYGFSILIELVLLLETGKTGVLGLCIVQLL